MRKRAKSSAQTATVAAGRLRALIDLLVSAKVLLYRASTNKLTPSMRKRKPNAPASAVTYAQSWNVRGGGSYRYSVRTIQMTWL